MDSNGQLERLSVESPTTSSFLKKIVLFYFQTPCVKFYTNVVSNLCSMITLQWLWMLFGEGVQDDFKVSAVRFLVF